MSFILQNALITLALAAGMFGLMALGRRSGARRIAADPAHARSGLAVIDASVLALLGLVLAFTFNGAGQRFTERRTHMGDELVVIEEGWRKIDLLPAGAQLAMRDLFRHYLDERLAAYRAMPDVARVMAHFASSDSLRKEIWRQAVAATGTPEGAPARLQVLFMGEAMAESRRASRTHLIGLVILLAGLYFVILDLEHPLSGLIHLDRTLGALADLRRSFGS